MVLEFLIKEAKTFKMRRQMPSRFRHLFGEYITRWEEMQFLPESPEAITCCNEQVSW